MGKAPFQFRQQPPRAPMVALDRMGRLIEPGHLVMFHLNIPPVFEVVSVQPVLDPNRQQQQGAVQVILQTQLPVVCQAGVVSHNFVVVGETAARIAAQVSQNGKPQDVATEPIAEPVADGPRLVLTDTPDPTPEPAAAPEPESGQCLACQAWGPLGEICTACGDSKFQMVL